MKKKYDVIYKKTIFEIYHVEAKDKKEAEKIATDRELNDAPDDEITSSDTDIEVNEVKE